MPSFENLKEEIREVYRIFDEDEAGNMSMAELARALYTVTGERLPRSTLRKLVTGARESLAKKNAEEAADAGGGQARPLDTEVCSNASSTTNSPSVSPKMSLVGHGRAASVATSHASQSRNANSMNAATAEEGIDAVTFEEIVMRKLNSRNADEEIAYTFALLEDQNYRGFITKESLQRAALDAEEPLTQAELTEMFDALVTGVPTAAIDLVTFRSVQEAALKAHEVEVLAEMREAQEAEEGVSAVGTPVDALLSSVHATEGGEAEEGLASPLAAAGTTTTGGVDAVAEALPRVEQDREAPPHPASVEAS